MAHGANGAGSAARAFACVGNTVALVFGCFISVAGVVRIGWILLVGQPSQPSNQQYR